MLNYCCRSRGYSSWFSYFWNEALRNGAISEGMFFSGYQIVVSLGSYLPL